MIIDCFKYVMNLLCNLLLFPFSPRHRRHVRVITVLELLESAYCIPRGHDAGTS